VTTFNLADLFELVCDAVPDRKAVVSRDRHLTYRELDGRANRLAHHLAGTGIGQEDRVGLQLLNGTEYIEGMLACFKLRAVPINVNYRYVKDELRYLFEDADLKALIVHRQFAPRVAAILPQLNLIKHVLIVEDGTDAAAPPEWQNFEEALAQADPKRDFDPRSSDDLYCAYTGGTTGMPKGVLWRQEDIFFAGIGGGDPLHAGNVVQSPEGLLERIYDVGLCALPTPPFMHVSAHWLVFSILLGAGTIVIAPGTFDPPTIWGLVGSERVNILVIVGDAMGRPLVEELEDRKDAYDTSTLMVVGSGGAILSPETKQRLSAQLPNAFIVDGFGSSETGTMGSQPTSGGGPAQSLRFAASEHIAVFDGDLHRVEPGSGVVGSLARTGHIPLGYHKDPDKTAKTFVEAEGRRWVMPGDFAIVEADGSIVLRGRGSVSINTGGEKVYPEEVESALKEHAGVFDAVVVGVPDARWGERVVAVLQPRPGHDVTLEDIQGFARARLAGYKVPRELVLVDRVERQPSGKPDYRWARERATAASAPDGGQNR
jgi:acyl-CoA synthetase (AMP-forming)/AMP-acid ligase II